MASDYFINELKRLAPQKTSSQKDLIIASLQAKVGAMSGSIELQATNGYIEEDIVDNAMGLAEESALNFLDDEFDHIILGVSGGTKYRKAVKASLSNPYGLRLKAQPSKTISSRNLATVLNANLFRYVEAEMGNKSLAGGITPNVVTGRMAHSYIISSISTSEQQDVERNMSIMFKYQTSPYGVFGKGKFSKYTPSSTVGKTAIRAMVNDLVLLGSTKLTEIGFG
jgi:hypothetical protein